MKYRYLLLFLLLLGGGVVWAYTYEPYQQRVKPYMAMPTSHRVMITPVGSATPMYGSSSHRMRSDGIAPYQRIVRNGEVYNASGFAPGRVPARKSGGLDEPGFWDDPYAPQLPEEQDDDPGFWDDPFSYQEPEQPGQDPDPDFWDDPYQYTPVGEVPYCLFLALLFGYWMYKKKPFLRHKKP